jgi:hypothetical protein
VRLDRRVDRLAPLLGDGFFAFAGILATLAGSVYVIAHNL